MGRRKDSLNSGTALKSPQLTALPARCRRSVWWANPIASPLSQTWKAIDDSNSPILKKMKTRTLIWWSWRLELSSGEVEDSNSHLVKLKTRTLLLAQFHTLEPIVSTVRHVTGNDKDYLRKIPRVVLVEIRTWLRATIGVLPTYATGETQGMKRVRVWVERNLLFHTISNHWFSSRNLKG